MLDKKLLIELKEYIEKHTDPLETSLLEFPAAQDSVFENVPHYELEDFINNTRKPTFSQVLFNFIDKKGLNDSEIYKKAGIDRRHFSKIRSKHNYRPGKSSVIALAMALELDKKETCELLNAAGYSLSDSDTFDLVIRFFLEKRIYDLYAVNQALHYLNLKPLSGVLE